MALFRVTVWYVSATALAVEGYECLGRFIVERRSESEEMLKAEITDEITRHVDDEIFFGPVSTKKA